MAQPYIGEIRLFAGNFAPAGWEFCNGQLLSIWENETLFNLIGTTYGGNGQDNFALPDLRGRVPLHQGNGGGGSYNVAEQGGVESVALTSQQMPVHSHSMTATLNAGTQDVPTGAILAAGSPVSTYRPIAANQPMATEIGVAGGTQPHDNMHPYLSVSFIISLFGIFPSPT